jgi:hypothetical protein
MTTRPDLLASLDKGLAYLIDHAANPAYAKARATWLALADEADAAEGNPPGWRHAELALVESGLGLNTEPIEVRVDGGALMPLIFWGKPTLGPLPRCFKLASGEIVTMTAKARGEGPTEMGLLDAVDQLRIVRTFPGAQLTAVNMPKEGRP